MLNPMLGERWQAYLPSDKKQIHGCLGQSRQDYKSAGLGWRCSSVVERWVHPQQRKNEKGGSEEPWREEDSSGKCRLLGRSVMEALPVFTAVETHQFVSLGLYS